MTIEYLIAIGIFAAIAIFSMLYLRRLKTGVSNRTPDTILNEVEVLLAYSKNKHAVELLREAIKEYPRDQRLNAKLTELE